MKRKRESFARDQIAAFRFGRHFLSPGVQRPALPQLAAALCGIQAQIDTWGAVAIFQRGGALPGETWRELLARVRGAAGSEHALVKLWGHRNTYHFFSLDDHQLVLRAERPQTQRVLRRRLGQDDGFPHAQALRESAERAEVAMRRDSGGLAPRALQALEGGAGTPRRARAVAQLLMHEGHCVVMDGAYLHRRHFAVRALPPGRPLSAAFRDDPSDDEDDDEGGDDEVEWLVRFAKSFGPISLRDFRYFRGIPAAKARAALRLAEAAARVERVGDGGGGGALDELWVAQGDSRAIAAASGRGGGELPECALLGAFDPLLLGHCDKSWIVPPEHYKKVWRSAARVSPVILDAAGWAVAAWAFERRGAARVRFCVQPFEPDRMPPLLREHFVDHREGCALSQQFERLAAFLGHEEFEIDLVANLEKK